MPRSAEREIPAHVADRPPVALTIAGSDPSGGAGLQADLKTFQRCGVYGMSVVTLITVQNTQRVARVELLDAELVAAQLRAVIEDIPPAAAKTGALGSAAIIARIAALAETFACPLVVDPVMISKHGDALLPDDAVATLVDMLLPHAALVTPNRHEAARIAEQPVDTLRDMQRAAERIARYGPKAVLIKNGGDEDESIDVLWHAGHVATFARPRLKTRSTHGSGCVYSAAITAHLARGATLETAIDAGQGLVHAAIASGPQLGHGNVGPLNLLG